VPEDRRSKAQLRRPGAGIRCLLAALALTAATFGVGVAVQLRCHDVCFSDISFLYMKRNIEPAEPPYLRRPLEYPVVVGAVFYAAVLVADSARSFYLAHAVVFAVLALCVTAMLFRRSPRRVWWWALAPPLAFYGTVNWDLLAVALAVAALFAYESEAFALAGVFAALGAMTKVYPGLYAIIFVADRIAARDRRGAARLTLAFVGTILLLNLPVLAGSFGGWSQPWVFQINRSPTAESLWRYVGYTPTQHAWLSATLRSVLTTLGTVLVLALGVGYACRRLVNRSVSVFAAAAFVTGVVLVAGKVYQPQYDLWLVPFFVLLTVPSWNIVAFFVADATIFAMHIARGASTSRSVFYWAQFAVVVCRTLLIVGLLFWWVDRWPFPAFGRTSPSAGPGSGLLGSRSEGPESIAQR